MTQGPRSFGLTKSGKHIVTRFYISIYYGKLQLRKGKKWRVMDMEECNVAAGTKPNGYKHKADAIKVAREYRDEYGNWTRSPF